MTYTRPPTFDVWLRDQYRPGATYATDAVAAFAADALRRAGHRRLRTPEALVTLLREHTVTRDVYAAAELAAAQYARTVWAMTAAAETAAQ